MSAVLSGPLFDNRFKFFTNFNYVYTKDGAGQKPGVNVGIIGDPVSLDTINFVYPAGPQRNVAANSYTYVATLNMDFQPVMFRLSGTYTAGNSQQGGGGVQGFLQTRLGKNENSNGAFSVKMTHVLSPSMYYELNAGYYTQKSETFDQALKDNYWAYGDSVANAGLFLELNVIMKLEELVVILLQEVLT